MSLCGAPSPQSSFVFSASLFLFLAHSRPLRLPSTRVSLLIFSRQREKKARDCSCAEEDRNVRTPESSFALFFSFLFCLLSFLRVAGCFDCLFPGAYREGPLDYLTNETLRQLMKEGVAVQNGFLGEEVSQAHFSFSFFSPFFSLRTRRSFCPSLPRRLALAQSVFSLSLSISSSAWKGLQSFCRRCRQIMQKGEGVEKERLFFFSCLGVCVRTS